MLKMMRTLRKREGGHAVMGAERREWRYSLKSIGILRRRRMEIKLLK
uniref:Uncharacterized protein n=1 Tax=Myoviridae sp. cta6i12 TaxID=2827695 RepID=A0A8S5T7U4_9CAUD|nr:MAG TPA: hypothetical protein [Myoviridae sp. cta6i12]